MYKKGFAIISVFIMILISFSTGAQSLIIKENTNSIKTTLNTQYNGSLSGFVRDSSTNPIEGALVRVYFHEEYRENYSDTNGYYHVTDIPICYCLKNATCSKEGYRTEWVLLSICENTTYDFTLYPLDPCYPVFNGTMGCNGWYKSPVEVSFVYDPEEVAEIWYNYNGLHLYTESFLINKEGKINVSYYWIDYEGVQSPTCYFTVYIDQTPPITDLQWETYKREGKWYVKFILTATDEISEMAPYLDFYINDILKDTIFAVWPTIEFEIQWSKTLKKVTFGFGVSDTACNYIITRLNGSDIKSCTVNQRSFTQESINILFQRVIWHFSNLFSIFKRSYS